MTTIKDKSLGGGRKSILRWGGRKIAYYILQISNKSLGGGGIVYCRWSGRKLACYRSVTKAWVVEE